MIYTAFSVQTSAPTEFIDITGQVKNALQEAGITDGLCHVFIPHTTAAVTINEAADPDVKTDILSSLNIKFPFRDGYTHVEGNSAAHIKTTLVGSSVTVPVWQGSLRLGTWQGIFFCEFDGPRKRKIELSFIISK